MIAVPVGQWLGSLGREHRFAVGKVVIKVCSVILQTLFQTLLLQRSSAELKVEK